MDLWGSGHFSGFHILTSDLGLNFFFPVIFMLIFAFFDSCFICFCLGNNLALRFSALQHLDVTCHHFLTGSSGSSELFCDALEQRRVVPDVIQLCEDRGQRRGLRHPGRRRAGKSFLCRRGKAASLEMFFILASRTSSIIYYCLLINFHHFYA